MPRKPRLYPPAWPVHVVQRGHNRTACFFSEDDHHTYLHYLALALPRCDVALHGYVLMTNHVHLVLTPARDGAVSRLLQLVGQRYAQYLNRRYERSGTAWEGRHKGSVVDTDRYLIATLRYVERNPVRAGIVATPAEYAWSSYAHHAGLAPDPLVTEHAVYSGLGRTASERAEHYVAVMGSDDPRMEDEIRRRLVYSHPLGEADFVTRIGQLLARPIGHLRTGRPRGRRADDAHGDAAG
ncbi:MAG: transposase [Gammaproteobacteria bacterium]|nr:transposase [Gammaproteobacteria bacterium]MBI5615429.1 transposase [Gammaproteobacteria bacterium]